MFNIVVFFFFKQKTAYEMRISDWSSDVCSSDLQGDADPAAPVDHADVEGVEHRDGKKGAADCHEGAAQHDRASAQAVHVDALRLDRQRVLANHAQGKAERRAEEAVADRWNQGEGEVGEGARSEEHTSELQSLMRSSYAVF